MLRELQAVAAGGCFAPTYKPTDSCRASPWISYAVCGDQPLLTLFLLFLCCWVVPCTHCSKCTAILLQHYVVMQVYRHIVFAFGSFLLVIRLHCVNLMLQAVSRHNCTALKCSATGLLVTHATMD